MKGLNYVKGINRIGLVLAITVAVPVFALGLYFFYSETSVTKEYGQWMAAKEFLKRITNDFKSVAEVKKAPGTTDWEEKVRRIDAGKNAEKIVKQKKPPKYSARTHLNILGRSALYAAICFVVIMPAAFLLSRSIKYIADGFSSD